MSAFSVVETNLALSRLLLNLSKPGTCHSSFKYPVVLLCIDVQRLFVHLLHGWSGGKHDFVDAPHLLRLL